MRGARAAIVAAVTLALATPGLHAQSVQAVPGTGSPFPLGLPVGGTGGASPVLTLDQDQLFEDSDFGKRVTRDVQRARDDLLAQNRKIEANLSAEEKKLTVERKTMAPEAFRKLADAFDKKVQKIRHDQDAKNRKIVEFRDSERKRFFNAALPVLGQLMRDSGAVAILNSQSIFVSLKSIDVTDKAIRRVNAALGDGQTGKPPIPFSGTGADTGVNMGAAAGAPSDGGEAVSPGIGEPGGLPTTPSGIAGGKN